MMDPEDGEIISRFFAKGRNSKEIKMLCDLIVELVLFCQGCGDPEAFEKVAGTFLVVGTRSLDEALGKARKTRELIEKITRDVDGVKAKEWFFR